MKRHFIFTFLNSYIHVNEPLVWIGVNGDLSLYVSAMDWWPVQGVTPPPPRLPHVGGAIEYVEK